ncbi:MAG: filamentous hemagglutinin N-terminal domain-containing protein [Rhodoferax sp.]|uniref:two-partner secretion domain-containing protein n=1 Tax=Rhodoferax sp. TaxID=50421 RepID=UPI0013FEC63F|nr:filamentous hemagglutinin N-terminal domain-containing protein [Rhodoferax sp.]NDP38619.1 filamentous hemagglutinin N-terminal domain-containing protein [Rhodoferax sp.]
MNHHYRIVWSRVSNAWVAVSELSKGHGKSASARKRVIGALASLGLSALPMASSALDLPAGAQVTAGSAKVQTPAKGALLVNQSTQRAVINWSNFSIAQGNRVTFAQPNASAATLNIVTGNSASTIAGTLTGNGTVYLINQNGIAITPTGLVDTRTGFIASTLRMDENAFMGGKYLFSGKGGSVLNRGQIITGPGGTVGLLGGTVANEGLISALLGKVALGSGEAATLDLSGDGFLQLMLPTSAAGADGQALVTNSGVIEANGGIVMLKASTVRQALREAVNMPGAISARRVSGKNGAIVLEGGPGGTVRVTGALTADGDTLGGRIDVTGAHVVLEGASLSATGTERGGLVRLGGAFQGGREQPGDAANAALFAGRFGNTTAITNATTTLVDAASNINVSATGVAGTGGTAIVWSDSTTAMQGAISARGALAGGAIEVSAKSTVQSVALKHIDLGKGGHLLIDPQDIVIDRDSLVPSDAAGNYSYSTPGAITHLLESDLTALLSTGVTVSLQASQDISWLDNFSFVTRTPTTPGGDLNLSAGRSVMLSGTFNTADGNWNIVANDTAAHGVVDAERGAGAAEINVRDANFINSNGKLSLTLADGAGNTNREVDRISLGKFNGNGLTAAISPTATPAYGTTQILLTGDINVYETLSLTGNLQVASMNPVLSLSGQRVTWTDEKTGSTIRGEQSIKFIENGVTTRFGQLFGSDAVRLGLGDSPLSTLTRTYGDSDPVIADILALTPQLHVAAHSATTVAPDALGVILSTNSLAVAGPGVLASAGSNNLTLSATNSLAFASGLTSGYFIDLAPATLALTITPRTVTPTVSAGAYIYGSPAAVTSLTGVVNGDVINPVAMLNGTVGVNMANNGVGFGFAETVAAGLSNFSLTGLFGTKASNYSLDLSGVTGSTLAITPKALSYVAGSGGQTYGSLGIMPSASLSGIVAGDDVVPVVALNAAGQAVSLTDRLPAGTYASDVAGLTGSKAGNYAVAATGNTSGQYVVDPKSVAVTYNASPVMSTYGTQTTLEAPTLTGILMGDTVTGTFGASLSGAPVTLTPTTPAGNYSAVVTGLGGASSSNYVLAGGNNYGSLSIAKKTLTYSGSNSSQVYGQLSLPSPTLNGIVGTDSVGAVQRITYPLSFNLAGESGAFPVGNYGVDLVALTGASTANYTLAASGNTPSQVAITPKPVTFSLASASSTYGTNAVLPTANLSGIVSGDVVAAGPVVAIGNGAAALNASTAAGYYTLGIHGLTGNGVANNYMLASSGNTTGALTIAPKTLTWAVASNTGTYGNALTNATTLSGLVPGDSVASSISAFDGNGAALARPTVGTYGVGVTSLTGPLANNYALATMGNTMGAVNIGPRPLTYTVAPTHSVYGTLAQDGAVVLSNVLPGDSVGTATVGYQVASAPVVLTERSQVGSYTAQVTALTGGNPNYVVASTGNTNGVLTIAPKPITFNTVNAGSTYGSAAVLEAGTLSGVLAGDTVLPGATTLATGLLPIERQAAGSYALITPSLSGAQAGNYTIAATGSTSGTLDIAPKPLTYELKIHWWDQLLADTVTYGEVHRIADFYTGFETPGTQLCRAAGCVVTSGVVSTLSGVLAGDDVSLQVNSPTLPVSTSGAYTVGTYRWTGGALSSPNYVLAATGNTDKTLTILPRPLQVSPVGNSQAIYSHNEVEYGSTAGAVPAVNLNLGDTFDIFFSFPLRNVDQVTATAEYVTPQGNVARLAERQAAGEYRVVMKGGLTGVDAGNYVIPGKTETTLIVSPKRVTAQFSDASSTYGEQAGMPIPVLSGVLPGDSLGTKISIDGNANFVLDPRTPADRYYVGLAGNTGADAGNYWIVGAQSQFTRYNYPNYPNIFGSLKIKPKPLTVVADTEIFSITYGDYITKDMALTGVLAGDNVQVTPKAQSWVYGSDAPRLDINGARLEAGSYDIWADLSGSSSRNYILVPKTFGRIDVAKFNLTGLADRKVTYGDKVYWDSLEVQGVGGDRLGYTTSFSRIYGVPTLVNGYLNAGMYQLDLSARYGPTHNYDMPSTQLVTVLPRELTWQPAAASTITYGATTPINVGTLSGMFPWDDVNIKTATIGSLTDRALTPDKTFWADQKTYSFTDQPDNKRLNAGAYTMPVTTGGLAGAQSSNYVLPPMKTPLVLNVLPKVITYSVRDRNAQYGNYAVCSGLCFDLWEPDPLNYRLVTLNGVLDDNKFVGSTWNVEPGVKGTIGVIDANGVSSAMTATTPLGKYRMEVSGLTGAYAKNYQIDQARSQTGELEVVPMWLTYTTSSAIYLPGPGFIGKPGIPTLRGPKGTPINGDDVQPIVDVSDPNGNDVFNLSDLTEGRYSFSVTKLSGKDAANYRISSYQYAGGPYGKNDVGTLDVFADTRFGMRDTATMSVPTVPHYDPPVPPPRATRPSLPSVEVGTRTGTQTGTSTTLGAATLSEESKASAGASAGASATGASAQADANAETKLTADFGAGSVSVGGKAGASADVSVGKDGAKVSAETSASANVEGGGGGSAGPVGDVEGKGTLEVNAGAKGEGAATVKDGKISTGGDLSAGVGASATGQFGVSGSVGSADATATLVSPGSVGGSGGASAGYSDGALSVSMNLGAKLGIGGFNLKLDFKVDLGDIVGDLEDAFKPLTDLFGGSSKPDPVGDAFRTAESLKGDPLRRLAFMQQNSDWKKYDKNAIWGMEWDLQNFEALLQGYPNLIAYQQNAQATMLQLLKTDPAAAIRYAHANDFNRQVRDMEGGILQTAESLGLKFVVNGNSTTLANR